MCWAASLYVWYRPMAVADFRREYGISDLSDVSAVEFTQLFIGLSRKSEVMKKLGGDPEEQMLAAMTGTRQTVPHQQQQRSRHNPVPKGDQYIREARKLQGKVHVIRGDRQE